MVGLRLGLFLVSLAAVCAVCRPSIRFFTVTGSNCCTAALYSGGELAESIYGWPRGLDARLRKKGSALSFRVESEHYFTKYGPPAGQQQGHPGPRSKNIRQQLYRSGREIP